jgi:hypothetical protein
MSITRKLGNCGFVLLRFVVAEAPEGCYASPLNEPLESLVFFDWETGNGRRTN